ncbi:mercury methylation corrinoid protein HgcA [Thermodesulfobacteriota bacterium]
MAGFADDDEPCCGPKPGPPCSPYEKPGYRLWYFVKDFTETPAGFVPVINTDLKVLDRIGTLRARLGVARDRYRVAPGLYCVGTPDKNSPVMVTANYKLSFDSLRKELDGVDTWILVLDTRGVNVWCAAGKKTFSTEEVIRQVHGVGLDKLVLHRELILPQLGAPGISAHKVKKGCGFKVIWGPVKARDVKTFLNNGCKADMSMRQLTFSMGERLVLIPVELSLIVKPSLAILLAVFVLSGISPDIFSLSSAWFRGLNGAAAYLMGVLAGAVVVPAFLPWLPMRQFYIKGIMTGLAGGIVLILYLGTGVTRLEVLTLLLLTTAVSSYAAMNFTGATPFTSPSGVEKEMRQGIPLQVIAVVIAIIAWVATPFI